MTWQDLATALSTGQKQKFTHCGNSPAASIWKSQFGIGFKCYRCHDDGWEKFGVRSVAEVLEARNAFDTLTTRATAIPVDAVRLDAPDVPTDAHLWVLRAGITPEQASSLYGFTWHQPTRRIFLPVGKGVILARAVYKEDKPKYKLMGIGGSHLYTLQGKNPLVIVEDILSAIKVNKAGYSSCAVLGTSISPENAAVIAGYSDVVLWLDPDKAGVEGRRHIKKVLGLYPVNVMYAQEGTTKDPKFLSRETIIQTIEATMKHGS